VPAAKKTVKSSTLRNPASKSVAPKANTQRTAKTKQAASPVSGSPKRVRRSAAEARTAILDAVERRMAQVGPGGIRLQDVARDVGMSHPTVLHHFGSREALIAAVVERNVGGLQTSFVEEITRGPHGQEPLTGMLEATARVLGEGGHARIAAWLALSGFDPDPGSGQGVEQIARAAHARRTSLRGKDTPPFEDTYFVILLAALALFGDAIIGDVVRAPSDRAHAERFRSWLAEVMEHHLRHGGTRAT
jgi:AcrR family transcriptional regulator